MILVIKHKIPGYHFLFIILVIKIYYFYFALNHVSVLMLIIASFIYKATMKATKCCLEDFGCIKDYSIERVI